MKTQKGFVRWAVRGILAGVVGLIAAGSMAGWSQADRVRATQPQGVAPEAIVTPPSDRSLLRPPPNGPRRLDPTSPSGLGAGKHALVGGTVHVNPGESLEGATVLINDGWIEAVGGWREYDSLMRDPAERPARNDATPAGYQVHDCTGMHVYAGFIDPFVEVDAPRPEANAPGAHWNPRVTPQRSVLDRGGDGTGGAFGTPPIDAKTAEQLRKMGFTAAGLAPKGGIFRGQAAAVSLAEAPKDASDEPPPVYIAVAYQTLGFDQTGWGGGRDDARWSSYPTSQMGAIALMRQTFYDARSRLSGGPYDRDSVQRKPSALDALVSQRPADARSGNRFSQTFENEGDLPYAFDVEDELEAIRAIKIAREFDHVCVVIGSGREFRRLDAIRSEALELGANLMSVEPGAPGFRPLLGVVLPLNYPQRPKVDTLGKAESVDLEKLMDWEQGPTNPRRLDAAGLTVALTTAKLPEKQGAKGRSAFWPRLGEAIKHGLPKDRALAMLTTHPAKLLGLSNRMGTIEPMRLANLVIADGDLFDHVPDREEDADGKKHKPAKVTELWIDGRRHEIEPRKRHELEGVWAIEFSEGKMVTPGSLFLEIDGDGGVRVVKESGEATKPRGHEGEGGEKATNQQISKAANAEVHEERQESKARDVKLVGDRLTFVFEHEPFGSPGVFRSEAIVERVVETGERVLHGLTIRAGGEVMRWKAIRSHEATKPRSHEGEEDKGTTQQAGEPADAEPREKADEEPKGTPEADDIAAIPEQLLLPHGGHGLGSYPEARHVLIVGATVWTCDENNRVIEDGVVRLSDGKVAFVGTREEWDKFAMLARFAHSYTTIDAAGKHVTPGIIDAHSHTGISKGVNEAGQAVTAEVRIGDVTDPDSISWYRQLAGGTTTVNSMHGSANPIGGQTQTNKIRWGSVHPDDMHMEGAKPGIKFALGENVKQSNWGDDRKTRYPQTRMGVETLIRDRFVAAKEYAKQGTKAGRVQATKPRSHGATKGETGARLGRDQDVPGSHRLAEGHGSGRTDLQGHREDASGRALRSDDADAQVGDLRTVEHRRGSRAAIDERLPAVPEDRTGLLGGTHDAAAVGGSYADAPADGRNHSAPRGDRSGAASADSLSQAVRIERAVTDSTSPSWLRGSVASWQPASTPSSLRASHVDLELDALAEILAGARLVHCHSYRQDEILMLTRIAAEFGFTIGTFQHGLECYKVADEVREHAIGASLFTDWWAYKMEVQDAIPYAGPILHDQGVNLSFNSDSDELARRMNTEAAKGVKYGSPDSPIEPAVALRFVTINPARQLGIADRVGSLEVGKDADVAVWSGPPLSSLSRCERTFVDGRQLFSLDDDLAMRERIARERARLIQKVLSQEAREKGAGKGKKGKGSGDPDEEGQEEEPAPPIGDPATPPAEFAEQSGRRGSLMLRMHDQAAAVRREHYLWLMQRGLDPRFSRCGDCGEMMGR